MSWGVPIDLFTTTGVAFVGALVVVVVLAEAKPRPVAANNVPKMRARNA